MRDIGEIMRKATQAQEQRRAVSNEVDRRFPEMGVIESFLNAVREDLGDSKPRFSREDSESFEKACKRIDMGQVAATILDLAGNLSKHMRSLMQEALAEYRKIKSEVEGDLGKEGE